MAAIDSEIDEELRDAHRRAPMGVIVDGFTPDRYDLTGAAVYLIGVAVIMYAPRAG